MHRAMRRTSVLVTATLFALGVMSGAALAMQPPGHGAQDVFDCVEGDHPDSLNPVYGHPGANGLVHATQTAAAPTAWNAVTNSDAIAHSCDAD